LILFCPRKPGERVGVDRTDGQNGTRKQMKAWGRKGNNKSKWTYVEKESIVLERNSVLWNIKP
jgi:hypothetical protein